MELQLIIVQSLWSKPLFKRNSSSINDRYSGGWLHNRYHYLSWTLSCLLFRRYYDEVHLITDQKGKEELIDHLALPYTKVESCLDKLQKYPPELWAVGKIFAYQRQKEPFLHVDGDVFIWRKFPAEFESAALFVQSREIGFKHYGAVLNNVHRHFDYIPPVFARHRGEAIQSVNAGIIGGTNVPFFQHYASEALTFIERNRECLHKVNMGLFNQIYEQYLFTCLAAERGIDIQYYLPEMDEEFTQVLNFHRLPSIESYVHVVGSAKRNPLACRQVEYRLRYEFPEYYERVLEFLGEKKKVPVAFPRRKQNNEEKEILSDFFPRTLFLLSHLNGKEQAVTAFDELEKMVHTKTGMEQMAGKALSNTYLLEKKKYQVFLEKSESPASDPFCDAEQVYRLMEEKDVDELLEAALVLHPDTQLLGLDWYVSREQIKNLDQLVDDAFEELLRSGHQEDADVLVYWDADTSKVEEILLEGWHALLLEFTTPTTGKEVFDALLEHFGEEIEDREKFKLKLVDFLTQQMVYHRVLMPAY